MTTVIYKQQNRYVVIYVTRNTIFIYTEMVCIFAHQHVCAHSTHTQTHTHIHTYMHIHTHPHSTHTYTQTHL